FSSRWRHTSFRRHWSSGVRSSHRDEGSAVPHSPLFHSEALVIPTPHACCHPEERSDEGSAVPHSPLRSIPRPLSSRRPTLVVIPRSAATRDLQSPTHPYVPFRGPCHPDAPRLLSSRGAQRRGICSPRIPTLRQVLPCRIHPLNQCDLLRARPLFDLLLAINRVLDVPKDLVIDQPIDVIALRKPLGFATFV